VEFRFIVAMSAAGGDMGNWELTKGHTVKIRSITGLLGAGTLVVAGALALFSGPAMAAPPRWAPPTPYTCTGGDFASGNLTSIPSGVYASLTVRGACAVAPDAVISVFGNVNVAPGAVLDAQSAPSTITVGHDVTAAPGSILGLGCQPNPVGHTTGHPCTIEPTASSDITVNGNVIGWGANTVLINGITVKGSVTLIGGGDQAGNPWPIKNNTIHGNLTVIGATPEWLGVLLNNVGGNVILANVTAAAGETMDVGGNTIGWNLGCWGLAPAVSSGFGAPNTVGGHSLGQCANLQSGG
jgi:hypothetical protein